MIKDAYYISSTGENKIHCRLWVPDSGEICGVVQIAHGVAEHIGRYGEFARFLNEKGYVVCGNDHLGHGLTAESPSELGFIAWKDGDIRLVDDMHLLHHIMKKRYPDVPYFLFGHSMGSLCARVYMSLFADELSGVILCGTGDLPAASVLAVDAVNAAVDRFGARASVPGNLFAVVNKLSVRDAKTKNDWLSVNEDNVKQYNDDPLCGFTLSVSALRDLLMLGIRASDDQATADLPATLPILLISGAKDAAGLNGKAVIDVCEKLEGAGLSPEVILYPGLRHEILHEDMKEKVYADILKFLTR